MQSTSKEKYGKGLLGCSLEPCNQLSTLTCKLLFSSPNPEK